MPSYYLHLVVFLAALTSFSEGKGPSHGRRVVCYLASWGIHMAGLGRFDISDAEKAAPLCTHIVYLFANLNEKNFTVIPLDVFRDFEQGGYSQTVELRKRHPHLKIMVGIGGWVDGSIKYSKMAKDAEHRATFISSVNEFLINNKLDGVDLNWQFPADRGGVKEDKANLALLIQEMRKVLDKRGFVVSVAVSSFPERINNGIDVKGLTDHAHFLNILSYEYHQTWDGRVGPSAPLYAPDGFCINDTVHRYLTSGAPAWKLNIGASAYGTDYFLANPNYSGNLVGQLTSGHGFKGTYNDVEGFMAYNELCWEMQSGGWHVVWDNVSLTPFARNADRVVSFDNPESYDAKIKFAMEKQLGGIIFYGLEKDDFRGDCTTSNGPYPLLRSIHTALTKYSVFDYNEIKLLCKTKFANFFWNGLKE